MRDLILGTAGHIDHGKTALVKALTGTDCDRLPEEKARGITIDIGFARLDLGDYRIGVVDCPGHERFIKNMLAGATGIDLALLIVAADDSVMPQTREHLEILRLLGLKHGVIALTKADLVDETTREVVELDIRELVKDTFLADAPIIPTSVITGLGIEELKRAIAAECAKVVQKQEAEWFRLAIDRSFVVQGHGTVVTGSVTSGTVRVGDELAWQPRGEMVRVRSLQNHERPVEELHRGQRAAINLAGVSHEDVARGQELATPGYLTPTKVLTVRLNTLPANRRPIKHRAQVRLHIGTAETLATISLLDCDHADPGQWALAQLFLEEPVTAVWGQPFVLRDSSAEHTLGGGQVLQPVAGKVRRRHVEVLERIEKLWGDNPANRAEVVAWFGGYHGATPADFVRGAGVGPEQVNQLLQQLQGAGKVVEVAAGGKKVLLHADRVAEIEGRLLEVLAKLHEQNPLVTTHDRPSVLSQLSYVGDEGVLQGVADRLLKTKKLIGDGKRIARADFKPKLSANQRKLKDQIVDATRAAAFQPPDPAGFAAKAGGNAASLKDIYEVAIAEGLLVRVTDEIYLHADIAAEMRSRLQGKLAGGAGATVAEIRDLLGTTRKYAVPLCEYLDRVGLTRREGDLRYWSGPSV
ncbi:MAG TPA: selenocysteine-specific translation elongation factor [Gemmataceae bacterium]|nr:selenocysteine-specific translation elongation factor [Gemmataceae bacterium]